MTIMQSAGTYKDQHQVLYLLHAQDSAGLFCYSAYQFGSKNHNT